MYSKSPPWLEFQHPVWYATLYYSLSRHNNVISKISTDSLYIPTRAMQSTPLMVPGGRLTTFTKPSLNSTSLIATHPGIWPVVIPHPNEHRGTDPCLQRGYPVPVHLHLSTITCSPVQQYAGICTSSQHRECGLPV